MSITPRPPIPSFLPDNAPFSPEQRAWLNGLFAGLYGLTEGVTPLTANPEPRPRPRPGAGGGAGVAAGGCAGRMW